MQLNSVYRTAEGVQVRNESFGLLFYDYRGPRLYFVPSKRMLTDAFFDGQQSVSDLLDSLCAAMPQSRNQVHDQLKQVLEAIERKGLIHGEPIR